MPSQKQEHQDTREGHIRPFKRPRRIGIKIYQVEGDFTILSVSSVYNLTWFNFIYFLLIFIIYLYNLYWQVEESLPLI